MLYYEMFGILAGLIFREIGTIEPHSSRIKILNITD